MNGKKRRGDGRRPGARQPEVCRMVAAGFRALCIVGLLAQLASAEGPHSVRGRRPTELQSLRQIDTTIDNHGEATPPDHSSEMLSASANPDARSVRAWAATGAYWVAPQTWHRPLYFEDTNLERHGLTAGCLQPGISAARFLGQSALLPYQLARRPLGTCQYDLGQERPGNCVPYRVTCPTFDAHAAAAQGLTIAGLILAVP